MNLLLVFWRCNLNRFRNRVIRSIGFPEMLSWAEHANKRKLISRVYRHRIVFLFSVWIGQTWMEMTNKLRIGKAKKHFTNGKFRIYYILQLAFCSIFSSFSNRRYTYCKSNLTLYNQNAWYLMARPSVFHASQSFKICQSYEALSFSIRVFFSYAKKNQRYSQVEISDHSVSWGWWSIVKVIITKPHWLLLL